MKPYSLFLVGIAVTVFATGCGSARVVRGIASRGDEVKFLYYQGGDTGVVKCKLGPDGALSACHPMKVTLEE